MNEERQFFLTHAPLACHFTQNSKDFIVEEIPLYDFSGDGEHLVVKVRKKGLTTWQMMEEISAATGVKVREMGYAGLKDKEAMTMQYLSLPRRAAAELERFEHPGIKILESTCHKNKIKPGHLKGNRFFIRLKKVLPMDALKLEQGIGRIRAEGSPNFFGYQRFGRDGDNAEEGKALAEGTKKIRNPKVRKLLLNAYQSDLFNRWLSRRIEISHLAGGLNEQEFTAVTGWAKGNYRLLREQEPFFKLLPGDLMNHYPHGRLFPAEDVVAESKRFALRDVSPTGLIPGQRDIRAEGLAGEVEARFDVPVPAPGDRRYAWIFPEFFEQRYRQENAWFELSFFLPKGSYATVVIEELLRRPLGRE